jgi:PadR family transcriptional regulator AphA
LGLGTAKAAALQKLETENLVTSRVEQQDGKPAKKIYMLTPAGRREFINSLFEQLGEDEFRSEFLLFARFASELPQSLVQVRLKERIASLDAAIAEMNGFETNHTSPADRWIIDYGRSCMAFARDHIHAHMGELIALARPDAAQAAE